MPPLTICKVGPVTPMVIEVLTDATLSGLDVAPVFASAASKLLL